MSRQRNPILSVGELPEGMQALLVELSLDDALALKAGVTIARVRKRTHSGPTFAELFEVVLPRDRVVDLEWSDNPRATYAFRHHLAVHWRRQGWIQWGRAERSLATGTLFRKASREHSRRAERAYLSDARLVAALNKANSLPQLRVNRPR